MGLVDVGLACSIASSCASLALSEAPETTIIGDSPLASGQRAEGIVGENHLQSTSFGAAFAARASARNHGVADEDIRHATDHALAIEDAGEDPDRWLVIGPDRCREPP